MNVSDVRRFDGFEFNLRTGELRRLGLPVVLERQPARALAALVVNAGRLVTRDELRQAIWPADARADFDRGLTDCLRQIRLALGDDDKAPKFVEALPHQGYRFIAALEGTGAKIRRICWRCRAAAALVIAAALTAMVELF